MPADLPRDRFLPLGAGGPASPTPPPSEAGAHSSGVTANGKPAGGLAAAAAASTTTGWFAGDEQMNLLPADGLPALERLHHATATCSPSSRWTSRACRSKGASSPSQQVRDAIAGHILAQASLTVGYGLNPPSRRNSRHSPPLRQHQRVGRADPAARPPRTTSAMPLVISSLPQHVSAGTRPSMTSAIRPAPLPSGPLRLPSLGWLATCAGQATVQQTQQRLVT